MLAFFTTIALLLYVVIPGILFRTLSSFFIRLKKFERTRAEEMTLAAFAALVPFVFAVVLVWMYGRSQGSAFCLVEPTNKECQDYRTIFVASYLERASQSDGQILWQASLSVLRRQRKVLALYYTFIVIEAVLFGWLARQYGKLRGNKAYNWIAENLLLPSISEWYVMFELLCLHPQQPRRRVALDVLTSEDHLYRGTVADYFLDKDGRLTGVMLVGVSRFDRRSYLDDCTAGAVKTIDRYWKAVPGDNLYVFEAKIINLNIRYEPAADLGERMKQILTAELVRLDIPATVELTVADSTAVTDATNMQTSGLQGDEVSPGG